MRLRERHRCPDFSAKRSRLGSFAARSGVLRRRDAGGLTERALSLWPSHLVPLVPPARRSRALQQRGAGVLPRGSGASAPARVPERQVCSRDGRHGHEPLLRVHRHRCAPRPCHDRAPDAAVPAAGAGARARPAARLRQPPLCRPGTCACGVACGRVARQVRDACGSKRAGARGARPTRAHCHALQ